MVSSCFSIGLFLSWVHTVSSHAYIWYPPSRNLIGSQHIPHCFNVKKGTSSVATKHPSPGSGGYKAADTDFSSGYCGKFGSTDPSTVKTPADVITTWNAGDTIPFVIVYNAQHGGQMEFRVCSSGIDGKSQDEGSRCLDEHMIHRQCVEDCGCDSDRCKSDAKYDLINSQGDSAPIFKGRDLTGFGAVSLQHGAQEVKVKWPANLGCSGGATGDVCTVQWFWTTAWGEQFWNCIDIRIKGGSSGSVPRPYPRPNPRPNPKPTPTPNTGGGGGNAVGTKRGHWTNNGATVTFTKQNEKPGRICYDVTASTATILYYQTTGDIYHAWGADPCCMKPAPTYGGDGKQANIFEFNMSWGGGFCECIGWNPETGGTKCAGQATAAAMKCPVNGQDDGTKMCGRDFEAQRPQSLGGPIGSGSGGGATPEPEPEPEEEPESEEETPTCEYWCDLPPRPNSEKCGWWTCGDCDWCGGSSGAVYSAKTSCGSGSMVTAEAECKKGADSLSYNFKRVSSTKLPKGCSVGTDDAQVRYNAGTGKTSHKKWKRKLCKGVSLAQKKRPHRTKFSQHVALEVAPSGEVHSA